MVAIVINAMMNAAYQTRLFLRAGRVHAGTLAPDLGA